MVFKSKKSKQAQSDVDTQEFINLATALDEIRGVIESMASDSVRYTDQELVDYGLMREEVARGIAKVAKAIKFDYDPTKVSTLSYVVKGTHSFFAAPQVVSYGGDTAIDWDGNLIQIDGGTSLFGAGWRLYMGTKDQRRSSLNLSPVDLQAPFNNLNFPFNVRIDGTWGNSPAFWETKVPLLQTFDDLSGYLISGDPLIKLDELRKLGADRNSFLVHSLIPVTKSGETDVSFTFALIELNGEAFKIYAPGKYKDWANIDLPAECKLTRGSKVSIVGHESTKIVELEFKGGFTRFKDAELGTYKIEGYKKQEMTSNGQAWSDYTIYATNENGPIQLSSTPASGKAVLEKNPRISPKEPAYLEIREKISMEGPGDKVTVKIRIVTHEQMSDPRKSKFTSAMLSMDPERDIFGSFAHTVLAAIEKIQRNPASTPAAEESQEDYDEIPF